MWEKMRGGKFINWIQSFVETNKRNNIILMEVLHRHDFIQDSCLKNEV